MSAHEPLGARRARICGMGRSRLTRRMCHDHIPRSLAGSGYLGMNPAGLVSPRKWQFTMAYDANEPAIPPPSFGSNIFAGTDARRTMAR